MTLNYSHAAVRAAERHGLSVTTADLRSAFLDIVDTMAGVRRAAVLLLRADDGTERWLVRLAGQAVRVVYIPESARIVTVLPDRNELEPRSRAQDMYGRARGRTARGTANRAAVEDDDW